MAIFFLKKRTPRHFETKVNIFVNNVFDKKILFLDPCLLQEKKPTKAWKFRRHTVFYSSLAVEFDRT